MASVDEPRTRDILDSPEAGATAIRGTIVRVFGYGVGVALSVASAAVLTRYFGAEDFGRYTVVISLIGIVAGITDAGMTNIGLREYSTLEGPRRRTLMGELLGLRLTVTVLGVFAAVGFAAVAGYDVEMVVATSVAGFGLLLWTAQMTYGVPLGAELRLYGLTALELFRQAVFVGGILVLVWAGASFVAIVGVSPISAALAIVATLALVQGVIPILPQFSREGWAYLLRLTAAYAAAIAVAALYSYVVVIVTSLSTTEQETGIFSAAFRVFFAIGGATVPLVTSAFPILARAARDDSERLSYGLGRLAEVCLILGAGLALVTSVGAEFAIDVVAGKEFAGSVEVLQIIAIALVATYLIAVFGYGLLALRQHGALLVANAVALTATAVGTAVLASAYGAEGAAVATILGESVLLVGYAIALLRAGERLPVPARTALKVGAAAALGAAVILLPGLGSALQLVVGGLVYAVAIIALRAVPPEFFTALRRP